MSLQLLLMSLQGIAAVKSDFAVLVAERHGASWRLSVMLVQSLETLVATVAHVTEICGPHLSTRRRALWGVDGRVLKLET